MKAAIRVDPTQLATKLVHSGSIFKLNRSSTIFLIVFKQTILKFYSTQIRIFLLQKNTYFGNTNHAEKGKIENIR